MAEPEMSPAMLLAKLAALDPSQRREVAAALRSVAETFARSRRPDAAYTLRMLAHMLDSD